MTSRMAVAAVAAVLATQAFGPELRAADQRFQEVVVVKGTARHARGDYALTFHAPVSLPGLSLGAGTYVFRHAAPNALQAAAAIGAALLLVLAAIFWAALDRRRRALHDRIAGTIVVHIG